MCLRTTSNTHSQEISVSVKANNKGWMPTSILLFQIGKVEKLMSE